MEILTLKNILYHLITDFILHKLLVSHEVLEVNCYRGPDGFFCPLQCMLLSSNYDYFHMCSCMYGGHFKSTKFTLIVKYSVNMFFSKDLKILYTGILHCISQILWVLFIFQKLKICGNPVSSKSINNIFPTVFAHFLSPCDI